MDQGHLKRAIQLLGGQSALARACGGKIRQQHIWNWLHRDGKVPAEHVLAIEQATGGRVNRHQLRPDIYPLERQPYETLLLRKKISDSELG
jgi:DNA-binding transcriptional regulator YdaS (Cro superfamily)